MSSAREPGFSEVYFSLYFHLTSVKLKIADLMEFILLPSPCFKWLPLFRIAHSYDAVYKWFNYLKLNYHYIAGYVIMPNHLHALIAFIQYREKH
jgi:hypothetical protein